MAAPITVTAILTRGRYFVSAAGTDGAAREWVPAGTEVHVNRLDFTYGNDAAAVFPVGREHLRGVVDSVEDLATDFAWRAAQRVA